MTSTTPVSQESRLLSNLSSPYDSHDASTTSMESTLTGYQQNSPSSSDISPQSSRKDVQQIFAEVMKNSKALKEISFCDEINSPEDIISLANSLQFNQCIEVIRIPGRKMDSSFISAIETLVNSAKPPLKEIDLRENQFTEDDLSQIQNISEKGIALKLFEEMTVDKFADHHADIISKLTYNQLVRLTITRVDKNLSSIFKILKHVNTSLTTLELVNCYLDEAQCKKLKGALSRNSSLRTLNLSGCRLTRKLATIIFTSLAVNRSLHRLNIQNNPDEIEYTFPLLMENKSLLEVDYKKESDFFFYKKALKDHLEKNKTNPIKAISNGDPVASSSSVTLPPIERSTERIDVIIQLLDNPENTSRSKGLALLLQKLMQNSLLKSYDEKYPPDLDQLGSIFDFLIKLYCADVDIHVLDPQYYIFQFSQILSNICAQLLFFWTDPKKQRLTHSLDKGTLDRISIHINKIKTRYNLYKNDPLYSELEKLLDYMKYMSPDISIKAELVKIISLFPVSKTTEGSSSVDIKSNAVSAIIEQANQWTDSKNIDALTIEQIAIWAVDDLVKLLVFQSVIGKKETLEEQEEIALITALEMLVKYGATPEIQIWAWSGTNDKTCLSHWCKCEVYHKISSEKARFTLVRIMRELTIHPESVVSEEAESQILLTILPELSRRISFFAKHSQSYSIWNTNLQVNDQATINKTPRYPLIDEHTFVSRQSEIQKIFEECKNPSTFGATYVCLCGKSGSGKSFLAYDFFYQSAYPIKIWIDSPNSQKIEEAYRAVYEPQNQKIAFFQLKTWLEKQSFLLVLDDFKWEQFDKIRFLLPNKGIILLIMTQQVNFGRTISVNPKMEQKEVTSLIKKVFPNKTEKWQSEVLNFANQLCFFPLAIARLITRLRSHINSLYTLKQEFADSRKEYLSYPVKEIGHISTWESIDNTFQTLSYKEQETLRFLSYYGNLKIPKIILSKAEDIYACHLFLKKIYDLFLIIDEPERDMQYHRLDQFILHYLEEERKENSEPQRVEWEKKMQSHHTKIYEESLREAKRKNLMDIIRTLEFFQKSIDSKKKK